MILSTNNLGLASYYLPHSSMMVEDNELYHKMRFDLFNRDCQTGIVFEFSGD